jgi:RNA-binding protein 26
MRRRPIGAGRLHPCLAKTQWSRARVAQGAGVTVGRVSRKRCATRHSLFSLSEHFSMRIEAPPFIDALFTTLRTKSYLPYNSPPPLPASSLPADNGIPIPLDAIVTSSSSNPPDRSRKRQSDYDDDTRPPKGPRVSQDGSFSRHGPPRGSGWSNGNWAPGGTGRAGYGGTSDEVNGAMGPRMNGRGPPTQYQPPDQRRGICRDYYSEHGPFRR